jgi:hypothetical protein
MTLGLVEDEENFWVTNPLSGSRVDGRNPGWMEGFIYSRDWSAYSVAGK